MITQDLQNTIKSALDNALRPLAAKLGELHTSQVNAVESAENAPKTDEERQAENARYLKGVRRRLQDANVMPSDEEIRFNNIKFNIIK